ncbi:MAG: VWA domain-containing protein [Myxococcales bacterium]|nr:VWA domain-containing protein [Myxococcales bacterium]
MGTSACMAGEGDFGAYGDEGYVDQGDDDGQGQAMPQDPDPSDPEDPQEGAPDPNECNATDAVTLFLSPDDSNSMSSPVQVREAVLDGFSSLRTVPIRTWEFMNYYSFDYPAAEPGGVRITPSLMATPGGEPGEYTLQIAVSSEQIEPTERAPINITLVLDASGSMGGHPMDMLKATSRAIAGSLAEGDVVSMVTWDTENQTILSRHAVAGPDDPTLLAAIEALAPGGGTDLHGGLTAGYELAQQAYDPGRINRIVLVSDGGANAGVTDIETIAERAGGNDSDGVYMVGVGVGDASTYNDGLMDAVTDAGKGASVFINDEQEAERIFGERFISTLDVAVRDVSVMLEMPPGFSVVRFSGEEISTDPSEVEPQHLAPNDAMVFHQQLETCAPEQVDDETSFIVAVRYRDGVTFEQQEVRTEVTFGELLGAKDPLLFKGAAVFAYAEGLQAHKRSPSAESLAEAFEALEQAEALDPEDPDLAEIRTVLEAL